jgi:hypothetical protein
MAGLDARAYDAYARKMEWGKEMKEKEKRGT